MTGRLRRPARQTNASKNETARIGILLGWGKENPIHVLGSNYKGYGREINKKIGFTPE